VNCSINQSPSDDPAQSNSLFLVMLLKYQNAVRERLDYYYTCVNAIILARQNPVTGLLPASVAVTTHGDYRDAWFVSI
jgi:hypothetical protein